MSVELIVMLVMTAVSGALGFWGASKFFEGGMREWKESVEKRLAKAEQAKELNGHDVLKERVDHISREIGDKKTGIRGELHSHSNLLTQHAMRLYLLDHMEDKVK